MRDVDEFLADADDVIADWEGSGDSASWAADGSHQPDQIGGDYYGQDDQRFVGITRSLVADVAQMWVAPVGTPLAVLFPSYASAVRAAARAEEEMARARQLLEVHFTIDASRLVTAMCRLADAVAGVDPGTTPPPRTSSGMTAREYRAARRAYRRALDRRRKDAR